MNKLLIAATALAGLTAAAPPTAPVPTVARPALRDMVEWLVLSDRALLVDDAASQWYRVELAAPCNSLANAVEIALNAGPGNRIETASSLLTGEQQCPIRDISAVSAPTIPTVESYAQVT